MENDAISRNALLEQIVEQKFDWPTGYATGYNDAVRVIREKVWSAPAIDVAPVVRCVDCKYRCTIVCPMFHTEYSWDADDGCECYDVDCTDDDGFCHLGERMDGGADAD